MFCLLFLFGESNRKEAGNLDKESHGALFAAPRMVALVKMIVILIMIAPSKARARITHRLLGFHCADHAVLVQS